MSPAGIVSGAQRSKRGGGFWIPGAVLAVLEALVGIRLILSPLSVSRLVLTIGGAIWKFDEVKNSCVGRFDKEVGEIKIS